MKECSKSIIRRLADSNFIRKYFVGSGLDIGGKPDPLVLYQELFPLMTSVRTWDWEDGDAQFLESIGDNSLDFVHSSHCLEHLVDPFEGIKNWFRAVKPGGYLVITVPDEDMYEQGVFPSSFNRDHKWSFTIYKNNSWNSRSVNVLDILLSLGDELEIIKIELLTSNYRKNFPRYDQTITPIAECGIEMIIRKKLPQSQENKLEEHTLLSREMLVHLNQYKDDISSLKESNKTSPPFLNDAPLK